MIKSVEQETGIEYPETYLVYAMILDHDGNFYDVPHGVTTHRLASNNAKSFSEVVYVSGFALAMLDNDVLMGVLVEEFLHYLFRTIYLANSKSWKGLPDKEMMEPIQDWFKNQYFIDCFQKAQAGYQAQDKPNVKVWGDKKYPAISLSSLPNFEADKDQIYVFNSDPQLLQQLQKRGKILLPRV